VKVMLRRMDETQSFTAWGMPLCFVQRILTFSIISQRKFASIAH